MKNSNPIGQGHVSTSSDWISHKLDQPTFMKRTLLKT